MRPSRSNRTEVETRFHMTDDRVTRIQTNTALAVFLSGWDSQISFSMIHGRSAFRGVDHGWHGAGLERRAWTHAAPRLVWRTRRIPPRRHRPEPQDAGTSSPRTSAPATGCVVSGGAKRAESKGKGHPISHTQSNRSEGSLLSENRLFRQHRPIADIPSTPPKATFARGPNQPKAEAFAKNHEGRTLAPRTCSHGLATGKG